MKLQHFGLLPLVSLARFHIVHAQEAPFAAIRASMAHGAVLRPDLERDGFVPQPRADAFLTRECRQPLVEPGESEM
ncbi:MAG: hypothetical protein HYY24_29045 [Verrucomicrobia bacterium]|nr:hypothetical protein [Verrucomicrobiota bacterium]